METTVDETVIQKKKLLKVNRSAVKSASKHLLNQK